jgi:uroporphyrin-III C-methyltransferase/precorrin-2 dehydrogenase/sirohydrochlorin ferrochelatase
VAQGVVDFPDGPAVILIGRAIASGDWSATAAAAQNSFKVA